MGRGWQSSDRALHRRLQLGAYLGVKPQGLGLFCLRSRGVCCIFMGRSSFPRTRVLGSNCSAREQEGHLGDEETELLVLTPLSPSRCASVLAVFRKLVLCRNEKNSFKSLARRHLVPQGTPRRIADSRGTSGVSVCLCFLPGRAHPMNREAGRQPPPGQASRRTLLRGHRGLPSAFPRCGDLTRALGLALCIISY